VDNSVLTTICGYSTRVNRSAHLLDDLQHEGIADVLYDGSEPTHTLDREY
jgi:hypothetical protein